MDIKKSSALGFEKRFKNKTPKYIIIHYTDTVDVDETIKLLLEADVSTHYLVDIDGSITQFVDEEMRAWHSGTASWYDELDINSSSIGIEIQNTGHTYGHQEFPAIQIAAVIELTKDIMQRHNIPPQNVIGHSDASPGRKQDPGHLFPWKKLSENGIGVWPTAEDMESAEIILNNQEKIEELLTQIGYAPTGDKLNFKQLITAFQRHFEPEVFIDGNTGTPTVNTVALMLSLVKES